MPALNSNLREKHNNFVTVDIGSYHVSTDGTVLRTLLGSCVSVCLFDPYVAIGGMNHILLSDAADLRKFNVNARYGIHAMEILINEMLKAGAYKKRLKAKAFGGANVLKRASEFNSPGEKNIEFVLEFLKMEEIELVSHDLGGNDSRVIFFHTDNFDVFVRKTSKELKQKALKLERRQSRICSIANNEGNIELFA